MLCIQSRDITKFIFVIIYKCDSRGFSNKLVALSYCHKLMQWLVIDSNQKNAENIGLAYLKPNFQGHVTQCNADTASIFPFP